MPGRRQEEEQVLNRYDVTNLGWQVDNFLKVFEGEYLKQPFIEIIIRIGKNSELANQMLALGTLNTEAMKQNLLIFYHVFSGYSDQIKDRRTILGKIDLAVKDSKKSGISYNEAVTFYNEFVTGPIKNTSEKLEKALRDLGETRFAREADAGTAAVGEVKPAWEERPQERHRWLPEDYINYAISEIKPADEAEFANNVRVRGEFNRLVEVHPEFKQYEGYWRTALTTWTVLYKADPRSGGNGFTIDYKAYLEKSFQQSGFDVTHVHEILRNKRFGNLAMRVLALLELYMYDAGENCVGYTLKNNLTNVGPVDDLRVAQEEENKKPEKDRKTVELLEDSSGRKLKKGTVIVRPGQFLARNMDGNESNLREAIELIVKDNGWLTKAKNSGTNAAEKHLIDNIATHAFRLANAFDLRGHFFLDDTAAAVTKGFGGEDYSWMASPQVTVGYDMNRYAREPKASHYLLAVVDVPNEWHEKAAHNTFFNSTGDVVAKNDDIRSIIKRSKILTNPTRVLDLYNRVASLPKDATDVQKREHAELRTALKSLEARAAKARIEDGEVETERIRSWFEGFLSESDVHRCLAKALEKDYSVGKASHPIRPREDGNGYEFVPKGSTFPTLYDFYVGQMMKDAVPKAGRIVTAEMGDLARAQKIIFNDAQFEEYAKKYFRDSSDKREKGFNMYLTARSGWMKALDIIKEPVKPIDGEALLRKLDVFLSELGKAKIVDGAHHNMMNVLALLFLIKMFKYLEPRSNPEFERFRNLALKKVQDQDSSQSGGGIPPQVKAYMTWLLSEARSDQRPQDRDGDLLRPMNPSHHEKEHQKVEESTRGMEPGLSMSLRKLLIKTEHTMGEIEGHEEKKEGKSDIPPGPIKWEEQDTSTKSS
ncbi:MAG: hypothetical protein BroJett025_11030 [Patescibacteria group bacterium]|nr:MAG: hypothetical protein BroJett025_11030 [Patescibacteria group bacterium]